MFTFVLRCPALNRYSFAGTLGVIALLGGCGGLLGLDDYEVGGETTSSGGSAGSAGSGGVAGSGGDGTATSSGGSGGSAGAESGGSAGAAGTGGCTRDRDCDDRNECTINACEDGRCVHRTAPLGTECSAGVCNGVDGGERCVACVNDEAGTGRDAGCPAGAPECDDSGEPHCTGCNSDQDCDDGIDCTTDSCEGSSCKNQVKPAGSSCSDGVCNGQGKPESCVACVDDQAHGVDSGCDSAAPACDGTRSPPECVECVADADCDDDNDCTTDSCRDGACRAVTTPAGTSCLGGYCNGEAGGESCGDCVDTASGDEVDLGCAAGAPRCDMSLNPARCIDCVDNSGCDDGIACTTDTCTDGVCENTPKDSACADSGDVCSPSLCVADVGCQVVDISVDSELLVDGNLDSLSPNWQQASSSGYYIVSADTSIDPDNAPILAETSPYFAWLGGVPGEFSEIFQRVSLPEGTISLQLSFYYRIASSVTTDDFDVAGARLRNATGDDELYVFADWANQDESLGWQPFEASIDAASWAGDDVQVYFFAQMSERADGDESNTNFFIDSVSLVATVCD